MTERCAADARSVPETRRGHAASGKLINCHSSEALIPGFQPNSMLQPIHEPLDRIRCDSGYGNCGFERGIVDRFEKAIIRAPSAGRLSRPLIASIFGMWTAAVGHRVPLHRIGGVFRGGERIWHRGPSPGRVEFLLDCRGGAATTGSRPAHGQSGEYQTDCALFIFGCAASPVDRATAAGRDAYGKPDNQMA
jgi:hypothetical protein